MTTATARTVRASTVIHDPETGDAWVSTPEGNLTSTTGAAGAGILPRVGGFFRGLWNFVKSGWASVKRALHLDAVFDRVQTGYQWARAKVSAAMRFLGTDGLIGAGMLGISTSTGRRVIGFVLSPALWLVRKAGMGWLWVESSLTNQGEGGLRNWLADKMASARVWAVGSVDGKTEGIFEKAVGWVAEHLGRHLLVDSLAMRTLRAVGTFLLGRKLLLGAAGYFSLFATQPWLMPLCTALLAFAVVVPFEPEAQAVRSRIRTRIEARKPVVAAAGEATSEHVEGAVHEAGEQARADQAAAAEQAKHDLEVDANTPIAAALATGKIVAQNRTQRRTTTRKTAASARR